MYTKENEKLGMTISNMIFTKIKKYKYIIGIKLEYILSHTLISFNFKTDIINKRH